MFLVWKSTSVKTWESLRLWGSVPDQGIIFRDVDSTRNLGPTVKFNPLTYSERNQGIYPEYKEYFTRHDYLSLKHNSKGLRKAIKKSLN